MRPSLASFALRRGPALSDSGLELIPAIIAKRQSLSSGNVGRAIPVGAVNWQRQTVEFKDRLKKERDDQDLTNESLAKKAGVHGSMIGRWISGGRGGSERPHGPRAKRLAEALGVSSDWLYDGIGPRVAPKPAVNAAQVSANLAHALEAYPWNDAVHSPELMRDVMGQLEREAFANEGLDYPQAWWLARVDRLVKEWLGRVKSVPKPEPSPETSEPSDEFKAHKKAKPRR